MSNELVKNLGELNGAVKNYVQAQIDLAKLLLLEKASRLITLKDGRIESDVARETGR